MSYHAVSNPVRPEMWRLRQVLFHQRLAEPWTRWGVDQAEQRFRGERERSLAETGRFGVG